MRTTARLLTVSLTSALSLAACGKRGVESKACVDYFAKTEACAAKASAIKGDALRQGAKVSKENFEKNLNPMAVEKSCEMMAESLDRDPDCK